jgi:hypothetical protein
VGGIGVVASIGRGGLAIQIGQRADGGAPSGSLLVLGAHGGGGGGGSVRARERGGEGKQGGRTERERERET